MLDAFMLARIQFASLISFHILFPTITIGLAWILFYVRVMHSTTKDETWFHIYRFWVKVFALNFALGVISGIPMSFQFATNWPGFMETVGNIAGPLLFYEVITAFFLEATFLGIMLFGYRYVPGWLHTLSAFIVAVGTSLSAFWILALNSWMQTPAGYEMIDGVAHVTSWVEAIFNPSFKYRLIHMLLACGLTASFLMAGLSAYKTLKGNNSAYILRTRKLAISLAAVLIPLQIWAGDSHGLNTLEYQPAKVAAMEAHWEQHEGGVPLIVFAIPDEEEEKNHFEIAIPKLGSVILTHSLDGQIPGLKEFDQRPPVLPVFLSFRVMVGIGVLMLLISWACAFQYYVKKRKDLSPLLLKALVAMTFSGWVAVLAGWYTTEIGRQPWIVQGLLTVEEAAADHATSLLGTSLVTYLSVYFFLLVSFLLTLFFLARKAPHVESPVG